MFSADKLKAASTSRTTSTQPANKANHEAAANPVRNYVAASTFTNTSKSVTSQLKTDFAPKPGNTQRLLRQTTVVGVPESLDSKTANPATVYQRSNNNKAELQKSLSLSQARQPNPTKRIVIPFKHAGELAVLTDLDDAGSNQDAKLTHRIGYSNKSTVRDPSSKQANDQSSQGSHTLAALLLAEHNRRESEAKAKRSLKPPIPKFAKQKSVSALPTKTEDAVLNGPKAIITALAKQSEPSHRRTITEDVRNRRRSNSLTIPKASLTTSVSRNNVNENQASVTFRQVNGKAAAGMSNASVKQGSVKSTFATKPSHSTSKRPSVIEIMKVHSTTPPALYSDDLMKVQSSCKPDTSTKPKFMKQKSLQQDAPFRSKADTTTLSTTKLSTRNETSTRHPKASQSATITKPSAKPSAASATSSLHKRYASEANIWQSSKPPSERQTANDADERLVMLPSDHPLLEKYQAALTKQLTDQKTKLSMDIKELEGILKSREKDRESVVKELSSAFEELKRLALQIESKRSELEVATQTRKKEESTVAQLTQQVNGMTEKLQESRKQEKSLYDELFKINNELARVSAKKAQSDDVKIVKNAAKKALSDLATVEQDKKKQDDMIGRIMQMTLRAEEEVAEYERQIEGYQEEIAHKQEEHMQINLEIQVALGFERQRLIQEWKSAVTRVKKRDDAIRHMKTDIELAEQEMVQMENELNRLTREHYAKQGENEKLADGIKAAEAEMAQLSETVAGLKKENADLEHQIAEQEVATRQFDAQLNISTQERSKLEHALGIAQMKLKIEANRRHKVEEELAELGLREYAKGKKSDILQSKLRKLQQTTEDLERVVNDMEAKLSKDSLSLTDAEEKVKGLRSAKEEYQIQLDEKHRLIDELQARIERGKLLIDKKHTRLEQLRRRESQSARSKLETIATVDPIEATIAALKKDRKEVDAKLAAVQAEYGRKQDELVKAADTIAALDSEIAELTEKMETYETRKARLEEQDKENDAEISKLKRSIQNVHNEIVRHNEKISKTTAGKEFLKNHSLAIAGSINQRLKESELELIQLEEKIQQVKLEGERLTRKITGAEQQAKLWEEKLAKAKETKAKWLGREGGDELQQMRSEIHRMQARYAQLTKQQELLTREMEKAVGRREIIASRAMLGWSAKAHSAAHTARKLADMELAQLKSKIDSLKKDLESSDVELGDWQQKCAALQQAIDEKRAKAAEAARKREQSAQTLIELTAREAANNVLMETKHRELKSLEDLKENKPANKQPQMSETELKEKLRKEQATRKRLKTFLTNCQMKHPELKNDLLAVEYLLQ